jgi:hypothetical protein
MFATSVNDIRIIEKKNVQKSLVYLAFAVRRTAVYLAGLDLTCKK